MQEPLAGPDGSLFTGVNGRPYDHTVVVGVSQQAVVTCNGNG